MATGMVISYGESWDQADGSDDDDDLGRYVGLAFPTGTGLVVAATVYDIVDAAPAARRFNAEIAVTPTMIDGAAGNPPGMAISGRF
jgi:hypothetical protein